MTESEYYAEIINKYSLFDYDSIQFYININSSKLDSESKENCMICLEADTDIKMKCCNAYFHNICLYKTFKFNNKKINLEYKKIFYLNAEHEFLTNNIDESCPLCRRKLETCKINLASQRNNTEQPAFRTPARFTFGSILTTSTVPSLRPRITPSRSNIFNPNINTNTTNGFGTTITPNSTSSSTNAFTFMSSPRYIASTVNAIYGSHNSTSSSDNTFRFPSSSISSSDFTFGSHSGSANSTSSSEFTFGSLPRSTNSTSSPPNDFTFGPHPSPTNSTSSSNSASINNFPSVFRRNNNSNPAFNSSTNPT